MQALNAVVVDARGIAVARIALGLATILNAIEMFALLRRIGDGRVAMPVLGWIPEPTTAGALAYLVVAIASGVAITIGYKTAVAAIASTLLSGWVFLWDQQTYSSHRWLALLLVAYLAFAHSDAAWSWANPTRRSGTLVPWWPQLLMMTQLSVCYLFAALSKNNSAFLSGGPLSGWLRWELPDGVVSAMAIGTVFTELFLAVGLWFPRTRVVAMVAGLALHASILVMMTDHTWPLVAFALCCVPLYPLYFARPLRNAATDAASTSRGRPIRSRPSWDAPVV